MDRAFGARLTELVKGRILLFRALEYDFETNAVADADAEQAAEHRLTKKTFKKLRTAMYTTLLRVSKHNNKTSLSIKPVTLKKSRKY